MLPQVPPRYITVRVAILQVEDNPLERLVATPTFPQVPQRYITVQVATLQQEDSQGELRVRILIPPQVLPQLISVVRATLQVQYNPPPLLALIAFPPLMEIVLQWSLLQGERVQPRAAERQHAHILRVLGVIILGPAMEQRRLPTLPI